MTLIIIFVFFTYVYFSTYKTYNSSLDFGDATGPIHMSHVKCNGSENTIFECNHSSTHTCSHEEDQGVRCCK